MNILFIDTSTKTARVGLIQDQILVDLKEWESTPELGKKLLEEIDTLLKKHALELKDIKRVAVHRGKEGSSFMALRTGIVTGTMLVEAARVELAQIEGDSVEAMVQEACQGEGVQVIEPMYALRQAQGKNSPGG